MNIDKKIILEVMQNLCDSNFEVLVYYRSKNFVEGLDEIAEDTGYTIDFGLSKIMVDFDEYSDWVIKVPRLDGRMRQNFCELEAKNYEAARRVHLNEFFAETYFVDRFFDIPVYIQKRMTIRRQEIDDKLYSYAKENFICSQDLEDEYDHDDYIHSTIDDFEAFDSLNAVFSDFYSEDKIKEVAQFCTEEEINDFHSGNFGYDEKGMPKLIDFSGI